MNMISSGIVHFMHVYDISSHSKLDESTDTAVWDSPDLSKCKKVMTSIEDLESVTVTPSKCFISGLMICFVYLKKHLPSDLINSLINLIYLCSNSKKKKDIINIIIFVYIRLES